MDGGFFQDESPPAESHRPGEGKMNQRFLLEAFKRDIGFFKPSRSKLVDERFLFCFC